MGEHEVVLSGRERLTVTGVTEVVSLTDTAVVLHTQLGALIVQGRELRLRLLAPEGSRAQVDGQICALSYAQPRQGGWLRRLTD